MERSLEDINNYSLEEYQFDCDGKHSWFIGYIADYVDEDTNRNEDIECFFAYMEEYSRFFIINRTDTEIKSITFLPEFKRMYFFERFNKLQQTINEMNLDDFTNSITAYRLSRLIKDKFDFYICSKDNLQTIDDFIRNLPDRETTYYFGNTLDYHC